MCTFGDFRRILEFYPKICQISKYRFSPSNSLKNFKVMKSRWTTKSFKNLNFRQNSKLKSGFYTIKIIKKTFKYFSNQISKNRIFRQIALGILLIFTRVFEFRILYNEKYLDFSRQISKTGIFSRQFSKIIFFKSNFKINFFFFFPSNRNVYLIWNPDSTQ